MAIDEKRKLLIAKDRNEITTRLVNLMIKLSPSISNTIKDPRVDPLGAAKEEISNYSSAMSYLQGVIGFLMTIDSLETDTANLTEKEYKFIHEMTMLQLKILEDFTKYREFLRTQDYENLYFPISNTTEKIEEAKKILEERDHNFYTILYTYYVEEKVDYSKLEREVNNRRDRTGVSFEKEEEFFKNTLPTFINENRDNKENCIEFIKQFYDKFVIINE